MYFETKSQFQLNTTGITINYYGANLFLGILTHISMDLIAKPIPSEISGENRTADLQQCLNVLLSASAQMNIQSQTEIGSKFLMIKTWAHWLIWWI